MPDHHQTPLFAVPDEPQAGQEDTASFLASQAEEQQRSSLSAWNAARRAAAQKDNGGEEIASDADKKRVLEWLWEQPGRFALAVDANRAGFDDSLLISCCEKPSDARRGARIGSDTVDGAEVIFVTAPGAKDMGASVKAQRDYLPSGQSISHALAPRKLAEWLSKRVSVLGDGFVSVRMETDPTRIAAVCGAATQDAAWSHLKTGTATGQMPGTGSLANSGFKPDGLIIERWWNAEAFAQVHSIDDTTRIDTEDIIERIYALEIEDSRKSQDALRDKIQRLDAAEALGIIRGTIWITRSQLLARTLAGFHIGAAAGAPRPHGHLAVRGHQCGLSTSDGALIQPAGPQWWPLGVNILTGKWENPNQSKPHPFV